MCVCVHGDPEEATVPAPGAPLLSLLVSVLCSLAGYQSRPYGKKKQQRARCSDTASPPHHSLLLRLLLLLIIVVCLALSVTSITQLRRQHLYPPVSSQCLLPPVSVDHFDGCVSSAPSCIFPWPSSPPASRSGRRNPQTARPESSRQS